MYDSDSNARKAFSAQRSHDDAKAYSTLAQAAGQAAILINGGASTAILAFAAADKAIIKITSSALSWSLFFFALGVVAGAFVTAFQAISVQRYIVRWEGEALDYGAELINKVSKEGIIYSSLSGISFLAAALCFMVGAMILAISLGNFNAR